MNRAASILVALVAGAFSGILIFSASRILFFGDRWGLNWDMLVVFLGSWATSTYLLLRGARTAPKVIAGSFVLGAAEWFAMIPVGLVLGGRVAAEVTDATSSDSDMLDATLGGGVMAFITGGFSVAMILFCLLGYLITFLTTRELDLPPMFVPPVMLVRQARGQGRQARGPQAPAAGCTPADVRTGLRS